MRNKWNKCYHEQLFIFNCQLLFVYFGFTQSIRTKNRMNIRVKHRVIILLHQLITLAIINPLIDHKLIFSIPIDDLFLRLLYILYHMIIKRFSWVKINEKNKKQKLSWVIKEKK